MSATYLQLAAALQSSLNHEVATSSGQLHWSELKNAVEAGELER